MIQCDVCEKVKTREICDNCKRHIKPYFYSSILHALIEVNSKSQAMRSISALLELAQEALNEVKEDVCGNVISVKVSEDVKNETGKFNKGRF